MNHTVNFIDFSMEGRGEGGGGLGDSDGSGGLDGYYFGAPASDFHFSS